MVLQAIDRFVTPARGPRDDGWRQAHRPGGASERPSWHPEWSLFEFLRVDWIGSNQAPDRGGSGAAYELRRNHGKPGPGERAYLSISLRMPDDGTFGQVTSVPSSFFFRSVCT